MATFGVYPRIIPNVATSVLHQMWQHLEYPRILPNVATSVLHQMWQDLEYPRIIPNVATSVLYQMWQHLEYPRILPNVATSVLHQMWQHLEYPRIHKDSMFGHYWYFKCCHIWQYIECQKFPLLDISMGIPNVATFGGVRK